MRALRAFFMEDAKKLAAAGCDFFVCPDNTAHIALESPGEPFPIPGLHIGEVVAEQAQRDGRTKVGILGTKYTMTGPVYPGALGRRGIGWAVPGRGGSQDRRRHHLRRAVPRRVHGRVARGLCPDHREAAGEGCDAVALVCTEIPLLITQDDSPLPILDSTRLLAAAAVEVALGERPMPEWRGGPVG